MANTVKSCTSSVFILPQHAQLPGGAPGMPCGLQRSSRGVPNGFRKGAREAPKRGAVRVKKGAEKVSFVGDYRLGGFWVDLGWTWGGVRHLAGQGYNILLPSVLLYVSY